MRISKEVAQAILAVESEYPRQDPYGDVRRDLIADACEGLSPTQLKRVVRGLISNCKFLPNVDEWKIQIRLRWNDLNIPQREPSHLAGEEGVSLDGCSLPEEAKERLRNEWNLGRGRNPRLKEQNEDE